MRTNTRILFLNQMAGPLFFELCEDLAVQWPGSVLLTGHPDTLQKTHAPELIVKSAPAYDRRSSVFRVWSWLRFFAAACWQVAVHGRHYAMVFIVSNPPFLGLAGLAGRFLGCGKYCVLVYDLYPDIAIGIGKLRTGFISRLWDAFNAMVYAGSAMVFTIGRDMRKRLEEKLDRARSIVPVAYIPCWADTNTIKPIPRAENPFALEHAGNCQTVVLYSGNMGLAHNIDVIKAAALQMRQRTDIRFLFIGEGSRKTALVENVKKAGAENITILPFQPESVLPFSMAAGDIGIVSYEMGAEGRMVPSKAYYYMSAGLALLVVSHTENELSYTVQEHECGLWVSPKNPSTITDAITRLADDRQYLERLKTNSRKGAEAVFSRKNTGMFLNQMQSILA